LDPKKKIIALSWIIEDLTKKKGIELEREAFVEILRIIYSADNRQDLMKLIILFLKSWSGCQAVAIRLRDGDDFPYYETNGFTQAFLRTENRLCAYDQDDVLIRDSRGNPVLECMCGNILRGRFDPSLPFFTPFGSFWTNSTTELLASTSEGDRQTRTRNRCHGEGFESVALIPLNFKGNIAGLLQFNDRRKDRFTLERIALFERLAQSIAIALAQRISEESLQEQALLLNYAHVLICDADNRILFWNKGAENMYGWTREEAVGTIASDLLRTRILKPIEGRKKLLLKQGHWEGELIQTKRDGSQLIVASHQVLYRDVTGVPKRILEVNNDITHLRRMEEALVDSEERYRSIFEQSIDAVLLSDPGGTILAANPEACRIFGRTEEELCRLGRKGIIDENDPRLKEALKERTIRKKYKGELIFLRKDGTTFPGEVSSALFINKDGDEKTINIIRDITERKKTHDRLVASLKEKETLLQEIHHRVKNNLQVISSLLSLQGHRLAEHEQRAMFQDSQNRIKSMALVHEQLYQSADLSTIHFEEYLQKLTAMLFRSYDNTSRNIRLHIAAKGIVLPVAKAVPCGLIVNELVTNALKHAFSQNRSGTINLEIVAKGNQYRLTVQDDGVGLPEGLDLLRSESLGLQIVQVLVKQLDGEWEIDKKEGTCFIIHFSMEERPSGSGQISR
jgi:PAS domain S-box-containing protein